MFPDFVMPPEDLPSGNHDGVVGVQLDETIHIARGVGLPVGLEHLLCGCHRRTVGEPGDNRCETSDRLGMVEAFVPACVTVAMIAETGTREGLHE